MPKSGFTGISFPFRISSQGGVVTSTTSMSDPSHIEESIRQILGTRFLERPMESSIYSTIDTMLFEPNDESLQQVLKARMVADLERLEERIEVEEDDIEFSVQTEARGEFLYATITYKIIKYQTYYTTTVKVGEVSNE